MKSDPRDYKLDVAGVEPTEPAPSDAGPAAARPFLSVQFACCRVYQRVYRDPGGASYTGRCPKCLRTVRFVVGPGGSADRSFVVE